MKKIELSEIPQEFHEIYLHNKKIAKLYSVFLGIVPDINPKKETIIFKYYIPCPVCGYQENSGHSYNGFTFVNPQICCRGCGVYFRPVIRREHEEY